jgi:hypothetical protein
VELAFDCTQGESEREEVNLRPVGIRLEDRDAEVVARVLEHVQLTGELFPPQLLGQFPRTTHSDRPRSALCTTV